MIEIKVKREDKAGCASGRDYFYFFVFLSYKVR